MAFNLKNRHFLTLRDFTPQEIGYLLKLSADLKAAKYAGTEVPTLRGKEIALIFDRGRRTGTAEHISCTPCPLPTPNS